MKKERLVALLLATPLAALLSACAPKQVRAPEPAPDPKTATLVVLLPDPDGGATGRATASGKTPTKPASVELTRPRESTARRTQRLADEGHGPR